MFCNYVTYSLVIYMSLHILTEWLHRNWVQGSQGMHRGPLVAAATGSSASTVFLWFLREFLQHTPEISLPPIDLQCPLDPAVITEKQFLLGLVCGFLLWPTLELLFLAKQLVIAAIRNRITAGVSQSLYKVI